MRTWQEAAEAAGWRVFIDLPSRTEFRHPDREDDFMTDSKGEAAWRAGEKADNKALSEAMNPINWFKPLVDKFKGTPAAVVETTKSKTVVPAKKKYGGKAC